MPEPLPGAPRASDAAPVLGGASVGTQRPEPGLARGVWEAPRWAFFAALGAIVVLSALYAARRTGILRNVRVRKRSAR